jgi:omega-amidase
MKEFRLTMVQTDILWENPPANLARYDKIVDYCEPSDLIVFPEMFSSGFSTNPSKGVSESSSQGIEWMKTSAVRTNAAICGSLIVREDRKLVNRFFLVTPAGEIFHYDKKHLFSMGGEDEFFTGGNGNISIHFRGMRIRPQICYDLRFPVWNRNKKNIDGSYDYDLLVVVANWPEKRIIHWEKLLQARAIENQAWVCGVNRIGRDGGGLDYSGSSMLVDPSGEIVAKGADGQEWVHTFAIDNSVIEEIRTKLPFASDWDSFKLTDKEDGTGI